jgi:hypothetical protein
MFTQIVRCSSCLSSQCLPIHLTISIRLSHVYFFFILLSSIICLQWYAAVVVIIVFFFFVHFFILFLFCCCYWVLLYHIRPWSAMKTRQRHTSIWTEHLICMWRRTSIGSSHLSNDETSKNTCSFMKAVRVRSISNVIERKRLAYCHQNITCRLWHDGSRHVHVPVCCTCMRRWSNYVRCFHL